MAPKPRMTSFEKSSLIVQFNILFILISVIPLSILYYLYYQLKSSGQISLTADDLAFTVIYVVLGIAVGYFLMRAIIVRILRLTKASEEALRSIIGDDKLCEIATETNEVAALTKTFKEVIGKLEDNVTKLEMTKNTLQSVLSKVGQGISSIQSIEKFLDLIVETITEAVGGKTGILFVLDESHLCVKALCGAVPGLAKESLFVCPGSIFQDVVVYRKSLLLPISSTKESHQPFESPLAAVPLTLHDKVLGVLVVSGRTIGVDFSPEDVALLNSVAMQTAVAIENDRLHIDAERSYFDIISALALAVEAKDPYSRGHLDRVSEYALKIAQVLGLNDSDRATLRDAARLHDLGKIGVNDDVLLKDGPLTREEWDVMQAHPSLGEEILKPIKSLAHLRDIVRHHHEKLDGTGYPDGLKSEEIGVLVRILTVADIYDALRTDRPYRKGLSKEESAKILHEMGNKIDQSIVDALITTV